MNVVVDSIVAASSPELLTEWGAITTNLFFDVIDAFLSPAQFALKISELRPDILLVAPIWMSMTPMLFKSLELGGYSDIPRVIACTDSSEILKIQTVHHGYSDVFDLTMNSSESIKVLGDIHQGIFLLDIDAVWQRVPRPIIIPDISKVPRDEIDIQILNLITIGLRDQDLASFLYLSLQTIKNRVSRMLDMSGAENRTQLGFLFSDQQLISVMMLNIENEFASLGH